jgi:hypothetical protein
MTSAARDEVLEDVLDERDNQDAMFGVQNHHPAYWLALLGKQMGQLGEAIVRREWASTADEEPNPASVALKTVRHEAIQLIAVGVAMVEAIDRGEVPTRLTTSQPADPRQRAKALGIGHEQIDYGDDDETPDASGEPEVTCYHCNLEIVLGDQGVWFHKSQADYLEWVGHSHNPARSAHAARYEPLCVHCGRDDANGTHYALERTGHLSHKFASAEDAKPEVGCPK